MRRRPPTLAALLAVVALVATGSQFGKDKPGPDDAATAFLDSWSRGDVAGAAGRTDAAPPRPARCSGWTRRSATAPSSPPRSAR